MDVMTLINALSWLVELTSNFWALCHDVWKTTRSMRLEYSFWCSTAHLAPKSLRYSRLLNSQRIGTPRSRKCFGSSGVRTIIWDSAGRTEYSVSIENVALAARQSPDALLSLDALVLEELERVRLPKDTLYMLGSSPQLAAKVSLTYKEIFRQCTVFFPKYTAQFLKFVPN